MNKDQLKEAKTAILMAFNHAKKSSGDGKSKDDFIDQGGFRMFLVALLQRLEYWQVF